MLLLLRLVAGYLCRSTPSLRMPWRPLLPISADGERCCRLRQERKEGPPVLTGPPFFTHACYAVVCLCWRVFYVALMPPKLLYLPLLLLPLLLRPCGCCLLHVLSVRGGRPPVVLE